MIDKIKMRDGDTMLIMGLPAPPDVTEAVRKGVKPLFFLFPYVELRVG